MENKKDLLTSDNLLCFDNLPEAGFTDELEEKVRSYFSRITSNVDTFVSAFRALPSSSFASDALMEAFVLEHIGLNNESLGELAPELKDYFGTGLHIWQNPRQFAAYLRWLAQNAVDCASYLEIGSRWGGTFIATCEVLRRVCPTFKRAVAADLIRETPFIERYAAIVKSEGIEIEYFKGSSTSDAFRDMVHRVKPALSLIDGDHSLSGALKDHILIRQVSKIIVHHDISSDTCPDSTLLWNSLKQLESQMTYTEFTEQYETLPGHYFGIGVLARAGEAAAPALRPHKT